MNFALILFVLLVITGVLWATDRFLLRKRRAADAREPLWVEYGASFFPVIAIVFVLRSFLVEPFQIPSGSMMPTLLVGDFILVNKFDYGIRLQVINKKIIDIGSPQRGDVVVFRYPMDTSVDYIKRVVGLPGDTVAYQNKRLTINGQEMPMKRLGNYLDQEKFYYLPEYEETLGDVHHRVLIEDEAPAFVQQVEAFPNRDKCHYNSDGFVCVVPPGHYFMMGDNRDNSRDSRYWGFVPDENLVGKAFFIWLNFRDWKRIGSFK
jgi:signal peptidase I